jgi:hypothetical protein
MWDVHSARSPGINVALSIIGSVLNALLCSARSICAFVIKACVIGHGIASAQPSGYGVVNSMRLIRAMPPSRLLISYMIRRSMDPAAGMSAHESSELHT